VVVNALRLEGGLRRPAPAGVPIGRAAGAVP